MIFLLIFRLITPSKNVYIIYNIFLHNILHIINKLFKLYTFYTSKHYKILKYYN